MSLFVEDPAHLSKSRLKSDLVAHNVALPPAKSKKEVYVKLHLKHIDQKNAADFSSDEEEDRDQDVADEEEDAEVPDPSGLTDDDLKAALLERGIKAGPIVASTRALYEKKLRTLLQTEGHGHMNGAEKGVLYSDSEEDEENGEEEAEVLGSEGAIEDTVEQANQAQQESSQVELCFQKGGFVYPQCFVPSSRLRARASRIREPGPKWNSGNAVKSSERSRPQRSQIPIGVSRASSVDQRSGLGSGFPSGSQSVISNGGSSFSSQAFSITQMVEEVESRKSLSTSTETERELNGSNVQEHWSRSNGLVMPVVDTMKNRSLYYTPKASPYKWEMKLCQEPVKETPKDMFPNTDATPTGIYATRRRPIKGAAGRPVQYVYPDTPASPTTLERQEVERCLVPIHIQIFVFLIVACLLYVIYSCVEDDAFSPFVALLDSLNQGPDSEEGRLLEAETQGTPALSEQE
ncbi:LEM domain-containing protein 1 isoform X2 [Epinephelus fuscoguttatus]|uniref:LEM domain-containing protein 1 isoform X2 n=1 Tax=Epinephelus fuscoguttatus TaxID=293821 RepID=UPI0020D008B7|nr:LEM domain-containing protein 1 isoform X2 [Epinephelus fuscoguttatus]